MSESTPIVTEESMNMENIPAPVEPVNDNDVEFGNEEIDSDRLLEDILKLNKNGYADSQICLVMEKLHNVKPGMALNDLGEEDREFIDDLMVENCAIDIYSMDGEISCLELIFDTSKDVYIKEINDFLTRYRIAQEQLLADENRPEGDMLMLSVLIMPNVAEYQALMQFAFPFWYGRVANDLGEVNTVTIMFHSENIEMIQMNISEDELVDMKADALREMESGTGGQIFE